MVVKNTPNTQVMPAYSLRSVLACRISQILSESPAPFVMKQMATVSCQIDKKIRKYE